MGWPRNYGSYLWDHRYGILDSVIAQPLVYDVLTRTDDDLIKTIALAAYVPLKLAKLHSTFYAASRSSQGLDGTRRALQYLTILPREFSGFIASYGMEQVMSHSFVRDMLGSFGLRFLFETGERAASGAVT